VTSHSAQARIEDGNIVIRTPVSALPDALELNPRDFGGEHNYFAKHITDVDQFAKDVEYELNREDEDGTTLVHTMLDDAMAKAIDNGSIAIDYVAAEKSKRERGE